MTDLPAIAADMASRGQWIPLASLAIGLIVRLLKSDTKLPIDVPPRLRSPLALVLGMVAAVLDRVATGVTWKVAILSGIVASVFAIVGHDTFIMSLRGGKEIPVPGLMKEPPMDPHVPGKPLDAAPDVPKKDDPS